jgi:hypothetical protein
MNEHDRMRELLALGAADALDAAEERELAAHVKTCAACAAEMEQRRELSASLYRLPPPQAPAQLVERVRHQMVASGFAEMERRQTQHAVAWLALFAWTLVLGSWPILRLLSNEAGSFLNIQFLHTWYGLFGVTVAGWVAAGTAALVVALRQREERRFA